MNYQQKFEEVFQPNGLSEAELAPILLETKQHLNKLLSQNLPLFAAMANLNPLIKLRFVLRDENTLLIDQYLTNGGRAIPIVIGIESGKEKWKWGPRPKSAQEIVNEFKRNPHGTYEQMKTNLHSWYAKNKTQEQQKELLEGVN